MNNKKYVWEKRTPEWIKENPGKGTMFKKYFDEPKIYEPNEELIPIEKTDPINPVNSKGEKINDPNAGIYVIICEAERFAYVGMSIDVNNRIRNHKMVITQNTGYSKSYQLINTHYQKYGINGFKFIKYIDMPGEDKRVLRVKEAETMAEFTRKGYRLYNMAISPQMREECIMCPPEFQMDVLKVVEKLCSETDFKDKLNTLLASSQFGDEIKAK